MTMMLTILAREHNRVAAELEKMHPSWDNDKLYFEVTHMGQFPQDEENGQKMAFLNFFWALVLPNGLNFSIFLNCTEDILPFTF